MSYFVNRWTELRVFKHFTKSLYALIYLYLRLFLFSSPISSIFKPGFGNRIPLGLNLKFNKTNQEIPGYTKKDEGGAWLYSDRLGEILKEYIEK